MHRFRNYEKPDGWSNGQPEVFVKPSVIDELGMPTVNYESLQEYFANDLRIRDINKINVALGGNGDRNAKLLGRTAPFSKTMHINAVASEAQYVTTGGVMRIIGHEGRHISDFEHRKLATIGETAGRFAGFQFPFLAMEVAGVKAQEAFLETVPYARLSTLPIGVLIGMSSVRALYEHSPAEKRAQEQEIDPSTIDHQTDILFPDTIRTNWLIKCGLVPYETVHRLYHEHVSSITSR